MTSSDRTELLDFFLTEAPGLRRYFSGRLGGIPEVDDLTQEAWLRLKKNEAKARAAPGPYLRRIASSLVIDFARKQKHRQTAGLDPANELADGAATPDRIAELRSDVAALKMALAELPKRRREIFILVSLREVPRRDVARRYGVSRRTVESELRLALDHCAQRLQR